MQPHYKIVLADGEEDRINSTMYMAPDVECPSCHVIFTPLDEYIGEGYQKACPKCGTILVMLHQRTLWTWKVLTKRET